MHTLDTWTATYQRDEGGGVELQKFGFRARFWDRAFVLFDCFDAHVTRHWLCGNNLPEFLWKVPVGRPVHDEDGWLENSVAGAITSVNNKFTSWLLDKRDKHAETVARLPVDDDTFRKVWPEAAFLLDDDEDEEA